MHEMRSTDMSHAFHLLAVDCMRDSEYWFPGLHRNGPPVTHYALGLAGEVGELVNLIKKRNRGEQFLQQTYADEIADVFIYLVDLAHSLGINVWDAFEAKHAELEERWGARQSSGTT